MPDEKRPSHPQTLIVSVPEDDDEPMVPMEYDGIDLMSATAALSALNCPYFHGVGTCFSGCRDEPSCKTDEPTEGWAAMLREAVDKGSYQSEKEEQ